MSLYYCVSIQTHLLEHYLSSDCSGSSLSPPEYTVPVVTALVCVHDTSSHSFTACLAPHTLDMIYIVFSKLHKQGR